MFCEFVCLCGKVGEVMIECIKEYKCFEDNFVIVQQNCSLSSGLIVVSKLIIHS